jgi:hypothetical protein
MLEDKYIGLALALSSTIAIGSSFIITKMVTFRPFKCQSGDLIYLVCALSLRASTTQEREGTRILKLPMIMHTSKIPYGGQGW